MYNVLIVDDEPMICKGIALILRESGLPIQETFMAGNGFEALDYIRLDKVDLLITDIQMEQMNGIELMETVFVEHPSLPVVVLSAHGQFEYAQKAVRFGAKEYLVKPLIPEQLVSVVGDQFKLRHSRDDAAAELEKQRAAGIGQHAQLGQLSAADNGLLHEIIAEGADPGELEPVLSRLGIPSGGLRYCVMIVRPDYRRAGFSEKEITSIRDRNLLKYACRNVIEETLGKSGDLVVQSPNGTLTVLVRFADNEEEDEIAESRSLTMIAQRIYGNLSTYLNLESAIGVSRIGGGAARWPTLYREATGALAWSDKHEGHHVFFIGDYEPRTSAAAPRSDNEFIADTQAYIEANYGRKGMKLQDIADAVHLSPNYLSYLFKKTTGIGIWDYVTRIRMEEAKRLLLTTDKRRYEVADEIGYESPEHFSKIFKKYFGLNMSELTKA